MTPEDRAKLDNLYELVKENHELLLGLRRRARWGTYTKVFYWSVIIAVSLGAFYFIQPYVDFVRNLGGNNSSQDSKSYVQMYQDLLR